MNRTEWLMRCIDVSIMGITGTMSSLYVNSVNNVNVVACMCIYDFPSILVVRTSRYNQTIPAI